MANGRKSSVELTGDWNRLRTWCNWIIQGGHMGEVEKMGEQLGGMIRGTLRRHIIAQDLGWKKLSDYTIEKKGHSIIYVDSGTYTNSIGVDVTKDGTYDLTVSIFPEGYYKDSGKEVAEIAVYMEYGTKDMPARPLWRPVYEAARNMDEIINFDMERVFSP